MTEFNNSDRIVPPEASQTLKDRFMALHPAVKKKLTTSAIVLGVMCLCVVGYYSRHREAAPESGGDAVEEVRMDQNLLEKSLYARTEELLAAQKKETDELKKSVKTIQQTLAQNARTAETTAPEPVVEKKETTASIKIPEPPPIEKEYQERETPKPLFNTSPPPAEQQAVVPQYIGGIEMVQVPIEEAKEEAAGVDKKKRIYLPPSFMEATLLSGVAAPTTNAAKDNPLPVIFRVKDLAVLPNKVKANLRGCFIIGSGIGNLADERVHIRLTTLSCVEKNGDAVIDQAVKGFVVDEDGKVGLKGRVVAKMGIHIARTALAGFVGGMGDALNESVRTNTLSALGQSQSVLSSTDAESIATAGVGEGISTAAKELQKFYLQLAEQTLPVIEIGSTKNVTIVVSEGVGLEILEKGQNDETN